jgi:hypothetical protein
VSGVWVIKTVGGSSFQNAFKFLEQRGNIQHARIHNKKDKGWFRRAAFLLVILLWASMSIHLVPLLMTCYFFQFHK